MDNLVGNLIGKIALIYDILEWILGTYLHIFGQTIWDNTEKHLFYIENKTKYALQVFNCTYHTIILPNIVKMNAGER